MDRFLSNDSHLIEDRRRKPEGTHLSEVVKVRFTEEEIEDLQASAAMQTGGRLAPYLHDLFMEAHEERKRRHARMLAELAEGKPLSDESREVATQMLLKMAEVGLMRSMGQRQTA